MNNEELNVEFSFVATMIANTLATYEMQMGFDMNNKQLVLMKDNKIASFSFADINKHIEEIAKLIKEG